MNKSLPGGIYKDLSLSGTGLEDKFFAVPAQRIIEILYGMFQYNADPNVSNRKIGISIRTKVGVPVLPLFDITAVAEEEKIVSFGTSLPATFPAADDVIHLPSRFLMDAGMRCFNIVIDGGLGGDYWSLTAKYVEWVD